MFSSYTRKFLPRWAAKSRNRGNISHVRGPAKTTEPASTGATVTESIQPSDAAPSPALVRAVRELLRPLVRLLLRHQVTHRYLAELLKGVYVESAERDLAKDSGRPSDSRISLRTGVHRKDVRRLRAAGAPDYTPSASVALGARLVTRWTTDPTYLDAEGRPRPLARGGDAADTFENLVASVSTDIRSRAVLDEWQRLGIVRLTADDQVELVTAAFVPQHGFDEKAHYFGRNLRDHLKVAAGNLEGEGPAQLERSVHYGELSAESVAELEALGREKGLALLQELNQRGHRLQERDRERPPGDRQRFHFGVFQLHAADNDDD